MASVHSPSRVRNTFSRPGMVLLSTRLRVGFKIGADIGSSHDAIISHVCPKATIVRLEKADDATLAPQTGRVDAQVLVWLLALNVLKKNLSLGTMIVPMPLEATSTNVGVRPEDVPPQIPL